MAMKRKKHEDVETFPVPERAQSKALRALAKVAARIEGFKPAREVLTRVRAVPTPFIQYNRATRCGGHPIDRFGVVHGPSGNGKSSLCHGLGLGFLQRGHFYANVDAEMTTPEDWLQHLMAEHASNPAFLALRPHSYEETVDAVRELVTTIAKARTEKEIPEATSCLVVVDSIRKLVPENFLKKIAKHGAQGDKGSVDGMGNRGAQIKAQMNSAWLDELTPLLYRTGTAMLAIAREIEDSSADAKDRMYGNDWKMTGGKAIEFDSSLVIRVTRSAYVRMGSAEESQIVGERHKVTIRKTKVSGKDDRNIVCYFHTSNGVMIPEGFDRARDVLELAREYKIVEPQGKGGTWLRWGSMKWQGEHAAVRALTAKPEALAALETQVALRFAPGEDLPTE